VELQIENIALKLINILRNLKNTKTVHGDLWSQNLVIF